MIRYDTGPEFLSDTELLAEYCASDAEAGDQRQDALAAEIERRGLDL